MRAVALIPVLVLLLTGLPAAAVTQLPSGQDGCPNSWAFLEPQLKTRPEDGEYYAIQREAIRVPISRILRADALIAILICLGTAGQPT